VGTPYYMAPEILNAQGPLGSTITTKCDVYSFAIMIYELVTEMVPYGKSVSTLEQLITKVGPPSGPNDPANRPPFPPKNPPPKPLRDFIAECWAPNPAQRPEFCKMAGAGGDSPWNQAALSVGSNSSIKGKEILACFKEGEKEIKFKSLIKKIDVILELEGLIDVTHVHEPEMRAIMALMGVENVGKDSVKLETVERFIKWLGADKQILNSSYNICCQPWFWGALSLDKAAEALRLYDKAPGNYLVRWDDNANSWFITYLIQNDKKEYAIQEEPIQNVDQSVTQLIKDVASLLAKNSKKLKEPVPNRNRPPALFGIEKKKEWVTGGSGGLYAQQATGNVKKDEGAADFSAHDTVAGHYNFVV